MKNKPQIVVWEIISSCNLKCKHCYNGTPNPKNNDLSIEQQLNICDQLKLNNANYVQLSGGEVLLNDNWFKIATRLNELCINAAILTNGVLFDESVMLKIKKSGLKKIGFSLDGLKESHDYIRGNGTYEKVIAAINLIRKNNLDNKIAINTSINKLNLHELPLLAQELYNNNVSSWSMQLSVPDGNFKLYKEELMLLPSEMDHLINIVYDIWKKFPMKISLGDCIGHFNKKEIEIRSSGYDFKIHTGGCQAGENSYGIKANGDVVGCISLNDQRYVEGNLLNQSLTEILNNPTAFAWNKEIKDKSQLEGICSICQFGNICKGGCPSLKYDKNYNITENLYCWYNDAIRKGRMCIETINSKNQLLSKSKKYYSKNQFQLAGLCLDRLISLGENSEEVFQMQNTVNIKLENK